MNNLNWRNAEVGNKCYKCEMRTKGGDCHSFCPAYKKYKKDLEDEKKRTKKVYVETDNGWSYTRSRRTK